MMKLVNNLNEMMKDVRLKDMFYRLEENHVVICLEYTVYDYEFQNEKLMNLLSNYDYEWYNSVEIEVYFN